MLKGRPLLKNTLITAAVALLMRGLGLAFQSYITSVIGAEGVGLFSLAQSAFSLALTFATSGIRYAVTRLVAEQITLEPSQVRRTMRKAFTCSIVCGLTAASALYFGAELIAEKWIHDERVISALTLMAFSLPFISMSAVIGGYFIATRSVKPNAVIQIFEQLIMFAAVFYLLPRTKGSIEFACTAIVLASVISNAAGFGLSFLLFERSKRRAKYSAPIGKRSEGRLLAIAAPIALSAYFRTALNTLQHMLVPAGLKRSGLNAASALSAHGIIHGMVFPVLLFPSVFMSAAADLLIPELTSAQVAGKTQKVRNIVNRILKLAFVFSFACAAAMFAFGDIIGGTLYGSEQAGTYIRMLAPLVLVMYMDMITDGLLKGLGQQLYSMYVNIADSTVSVLLVWLTLPIWGIKAYLFMIISTELFNFALSLRKLRQMVRQQ
ncbi:MAG: oligosaccharide flippase family protein [Oscillospiraceae bacterium]|jgi:stage V sporulation protein B|nr:oligosaccharide flippase family protein [Oscillospiraceae bacterium]